MTTARDVIARFERSRSAMRKFSNWERDPHKSLVVPRVLAHNSNYADSLTPEEVIALCKVIESDPSEHSLSNIKKADVERVPTVRDWHPPFAFTHLLHFVLEEEQSLVTFNQLRRHPVIAELAYPDMRQITELAEQRDGVSKDDAKAAIRWRVGLAYYSFLKEQFVVAVLRSLGLDVRQHPLADALFRVDCWIGDINLDLYVLNPRFRGKEGSGRKIKSADLLCDSSPPFGAVALECETRHTFGNVHLPDVSSIVSACKEAGLI